MKVFVATKEGQGKRKNDFCWCEEDELVRFAVECDGEEVDGSCGCRRAMAGLKSHRATTTFKVVESPLTMDEYRKALSDCMVGEGWGTADEVVKWVKDDALELTDMAGKFPVGMVLEKRGNAIRERKL